ncbi:MAG: hypothetical protein LBE18_09940 [Planctomycetaceae bacterium]|jgi:hypothetical protein|nr:hypothetical protein [Planctomycetaceae bacterium]
MPTYEEMNFKIPVESGEYRECSDYVINAIENIIQNAIDYQTNKIVINTNLKLGLPMENINKIAGPFVEAWAVETFTQVLEDSNNKYLLINVEARKRLDKSDVILQFKKKRKHELGITAEVDVKATAEDIPHSGKSPNITSYARIRTAYLEDPDYLFIILSLKHRVYCCRNKNTQLMDGIMEVVGYKAYDLKYLSLSDISYNPALGTGQIQVKDIHYVTISYRNVWAFCQLLDKKYLASSKRTLDDWIKLAKQNKWIKFDE